MLEMHLCRPYSTILTALTLAGVHARYSHMVSFEREKKLCTYARVHTPLLSVFVYLWEPIDMGSRMKRMVQDTWV